MARSIIRNIENFRGLDLRRSDIAGDFLSFSELTNFRFGSGYKSIVGRGGSQPIAQGANFSGIHSYVYSDSDTGAPTEEIVGVNDNLWRLKAATFTVTRSGGSGTFTLRNSVVAASEYRVIFTDGGVAQALVDQNGTSQAYLSCDTGLEIIGGGVGSYQGAAIMDLCAAIDGLSNFTCATPDMSARVNGAQNNVTTITVDSGHTVSAGDYIMFWDKGTQSLVWRLVFSTTSTTIAFNAGDPPVSVIDNQPLGIGASTAAGISLETTHSSSSTFDVTFYYWEPIYTNYNDVQGHYPPFLHSYRRDGYKSGTEATTNTLTVTNVLLSSGLHPFRVGDSIHFYDEVSGAHVARTITAVTSSTITVDGNAVTVNDGRLMWVDCRNDDGWTPPSFRNWLGVCYIGSYDYENRRSLTDDPSLTPATTLQRYHYATYYGYIHKYDGQNVYRAGTPYLKVDGIVPGGSGSFTGTYQFLVTSRKVDAKGNIVESYPVTDLSVAPKVASGHASFAITWETLSDEEYNYDRKGAIAAGATTTDNDISVDNGSGGPPALDVGDKAYFYDSVSSQYVTRRITAVNRVASTYSITVDGAAVSVADNAIISNDYRVCIYRTTANGTLFYLVAEIPLDYYSATQSYTDTMSDATLITKPRYIEPIPLKEPDPPPKARFLAIHQGCLVGAGNNEDADLIGFSNAEAPEEWPLASGSFYAPATRTGSVSAIESDTEDRLAIFKPRAYYEALGDLDSGNFQVRVVRDGDYGIASHASLQRINGVLMGVSHRGVIGIFGGNLVFREGENLVGGAISPAIISPNVERERARGFNDPSLGIYRLVVPGGRDFGASYGQHVYSKFFIYDYTDRPGAGAWFDEAYPDQTGNPVGVSPALGWASYNNYTHYLSPITRTSGAVYYPGHLFRYHDYGISSATTNAGLFYDGIYATSNVITTLLETLQSPSIDKDWQRIKAFFTPNGYDGIASAIFWQPTLTITSMTGTNSNTTISSISFDTIINGRAFDRSLRLAKSPGIVVSLSSTSGGTRGALSGIELVVAGAYDPQDVADRP